MSRYKTALLFIISITGGMLIAELSMRKVFGIIPGIHNADRSFTKVDSLHMLRGFYTDSEGIFRVDPQSVVDINSRLSPKKLPAEGHLFDPKEEVDELYVVADDMRDIMLGKTDDHFVQLYRAILSKKETATELDTAILQFVHHPVNDNGFCSIPFKPYTGGKKKVLLLGDSFTWGRTVSNITRSFANELLAKGYTVYNTGISGADPAQYLALGRKYIPLLKPDVVIVNFALGSDVESTPRKLTPNQPIFYRTNAGYLFASPQGVYLGDAKETYSFVRTEYTIPATSRLNGFCSLTAMGTMAWQFLYSMSVVDNVHPEHKAYWDKVKSITGEVPYSNAELDSIRAISRENNATCIISAIPDLRSNGVCDPAKVPHLFENIPFVFSPVKRDGYSLADGHFNDLGHRQYAEFLDSVIRAKAP